NAHAVGCRDRSEARWGQTHAGGPSPPRRRDGARRSRMILAQRTLPVASAVRRLRWRHYVAQTLMHGGLITEGLLSLYPLVWNIITSPKSQAELYQNPF